MARKRSKANVKSSAKVARKEPFFLGAPESIGTIPTWEKVLILLSTYTPARESLVNRKVAELTHF